MVCNNILLVEQLKEPKSIERIVTNFINWRQGFSGFSSSFYVFTRLWGQIFAKAAIEKGERKNRLRQ